MSSADPSRSKQRFPEISPRAWEHPDEASARAALEAIPGINILLQNMLGATSDPAFRLIYLASAVRASERQFPQVHRLVHEACHILDAPHVPEVYVAQTPFFNAGTIGIERPFIVLHAAVLDTLTEEELLGAIGHELSHCLSGYALYKTLLQVLLKLSVAALQIPLSGVALFPVIVALMEWNRKSELSADRAALLVVQEPAVLYSRLMKLAGGPRAAQMDVNAFFVQAAEYEGAGNPLTRLHKLLNLILVSHPFPVIRLTELQAWVNSGAYAAILAQTFPTREAHEQPVMEQVMSQLKAASETYQDQWETSKETVTNLMTEVFSNLDTWLHQAFQGVGSLLDFVPKPDTPSEPTQTAAPTPAHEQAEIFAALERLRDLQEKGIITAEEFEAQKAKLLSRL